MGLLMFMGIYCVVLIVATIEMTFIYFNDVCKHYLKIRSPIAFCES